MTLDWAANFRGAARPQFRGLPPLTRVGKTVALGVLVLAVLVAIAYFAVLRPRAASVDKVNAQAATVAASNDSLRSQIAARQAEEAQLPELRKLSSAIDLRFPATAEQAKLFKMMTAAAASAGIAPQYLTNLTVAPPVDSATSASPTAHLPGVASAIGQVASQQLTLDAKGTPAQLRAFVANLEKLPRAFEVTTVNITTPIAIANSAPTAPGTVVAPDAKLSQATITGTMFLMPKVDDPTQASTPAKAGTTSGAPVTSGSAGAAK
jgi:Tfp pilus assembly protein PilO